MSVSDVYLGAEFKYVCKNITQTFRSRLNGWNILLQDTKFWCAVDRAS